MNLVALLTLLEGVLTKSPTVIADVQATIVSTGADKAGFVSEVKDVLTGALKILGDL